MNITALNTLNEGRVKINNQLLTEYNVFDYGATGDGVTDDTAAFVAAIAAMPATGGRLMLGSGSFLLTSQIVLNKNIVIQGNGKSPFNYYTLIEDITGHPGATNILCNSGTIDLFLIDDSGTGQYPSRVFKDFSVFNTQATPSAGSAFKLTGLAVNTHFENVNVTGFYDNIYIDFAVFINLSKCDLIDPVHACIVIDSSFNDSTCFFMDTFNMLASRTTGRNPLCGIHWIGGAYINISDGMINSGLGYELPTTDATQNFRYGIYMNLAVGAATSALFVNNVLIENFRETGIYGDQVDGFYHVLLNNLTVSPNVNMSTDPVASQVRSAIVLQNISQLSLSSITGQNALLGSVAYPFIKLTSCSKVNMLGVSYNSFSAPYSLTSCDHVNAIATHVGDTNQNSTEANGLFDNLGIQNVAGDVYLYNNAYFNGTTNVRRTTGFASAISLQKSSGALVWYAAPSGSAGSTYTPTAPFVMLATAGASAFNYDGTGLGIKQASPTAKLHIGAGTATANTAPFKFTSGTQLTTPEAGALETATIELLYSTSTTAASRGYLGLDRITATATGLTLDANHSTLLLTATGQTATLPTAVGKLGRKYTIKLTASGTGTVATTSSQTIDGSTTYSLSAQYKYVTVQSDNANWHIVANN